MKKIWYKIIFFLALILCAFASLLDVYTIKDLIYQTEFNFEKLISAIGAIFLTILSIIAILFVVIKMLGEKGNGKNS